jgi:hypothetical protein
MEHASLKNISYYLIVLFDLGVVEGRVREKLQVDFKQALTIVANPNILPQLASRGLVLK